MKYFIFSEVICFLHSVEGKDRSIYAIFSSFLPTTTSVCFTPTYISSSETQHFGYKFFCLKVEENEIISETGSSLWGLFANFCFVCLLIPISVL